MSGGIALTWEGVAAICAVVTLIGAGLIWVVNMTIRLAVAEVASKQAEALHASEEKLRRETAKALLDYVPIPVCDERHCAMEKRIVAIEEAIRG